MSSGAQLDIVDIAAANKPGLEKGLPDATLASHNSSATDNNDLWRGPNGEIYPTTEEFGTLPRVVGDIKWVIYTIAFVELCERFAYYGTVAVFQNFIQYPLPAGSTTGHDPSEEGQPGALNKGQQSATALALFNSFWSYIMPIVGGYVADTYWGRFKTINVAIWIAMFGHVLIIVSAVPSVLISNANGSLGAFIVGLVFFGIGVGFFKCNISPLMAEQYELYQPRPTVKTLENGNRVIVDPQLTVSIIYMRYYFFINVGALVGQISMVYAERYVGFWLSFTLPTIMFAFCPLVMLWCRKRYVRRPPTGSVLSKASALLLLAIKKRKEGFFWENVKPSRLGDARPEWMTFDDAWVDEVRRGLQACQVFVWFPIFWLAYGQMTNNLVSQASTMELNGVPNDIINNLNPFSLLIFIPIFDKLIYPAIARTGFQFTPIKKITAGFAFGACSMAVAAIIQHFIYVRSPCGNAASGCDIKPNLTVWIQTPAYILIAMSEIFASITGLEYAFTKAPKNMRSLVTGVFWFAQAFSSALSQAFVPLAHDPLLVWLYTAIACISAVGGIGFWFNFRRLDSEEEAFNALPHSNFHGPEQARQDTIEETQGQGHKVR